jgi:hypothetical protein
MDKPNLVLGCRVRIQGLVGAPQHNGKEGELTEFVKSTQRWRSFHHLVFVSLVTVVNICCRWGVEVGEPELLAVKPTNLLFLSMPAVASNSSSGQKQSGAAFAFPRPGDMANRLLVGTSAIVSSVFSGLKQGGAAVATSRLRHPETRAGDESWGDDSDDFDEFASFRNRSDDSSGDDGDQLHERTSFYSRSACGSPVNAADELALLEECGYENSRYQCHLHDILHCKRLPPKVDIGYYDRSEGERPYYECFTRMNEDNVALLARQLLRDVKRQPQPNITCLNISHCFEGSAGMRVLAGPLGMLSGLRILNLRCNVLVCYLWVFHMRIFKAFRSRIGRRRS